MSQQINQKKALESHLLVATDKITNNVALLVSPTNFQIGLLNNPSDLTLTGRLTLSTSIYSIDTSFTVIVENHVSVAMIECLTTTFNPRPNFFSVYLPSGPRPGQTVIIKDFSGISSVFNIRIFDPSGSNIDGSSYQSISTNYGSLNFVWNKSWFKI